MEIVQAVVDDDSVIQKRKKGSFICLGCYNVENVFLVQ